MKLERRSTMKTKRDAHNVSIHILLVLTSPRSASDANCSEREREKNPVERIFNKNRRGRKLLGNNEWNLLLTAAELMWNLNKIIFIGCARIRIVNNTHWPSSRYSCRIQQFDARVHLNKFIQLIRCSVEWRFSYLFSISVSLSLLLMWIAEYDFDSDMSARLLFLGDQFVPIWKITRHLHIKLHVPFDSSSMLTETRSIARIHF